MPLFGLDGPVFRISHLKSDLIVHIDNVASIWDCGVSLFDLATQCSLWDLSLLTRIRTWDFCSESSES